MYNGPIKAMADCRRSDFGSKWQESYPLFISKARHLAADGAQDPEDLVSQATLKVLAYLDLDREVENIVGLMLVCLLQVYIDNKRRQVNRISVLSQELIEDATGSDPGSAPPGPERDYIARQTLGDILDCISLMPSAQQDLFEMRFVNDLSYAEISGRLGITEACARQRVKKLRMKFQAWLDD